MHEELLAELRSLLAQTKSEELFRKVHGRFFNGDIPAPVHQYVHGHVSRWPQDIRRVAPWFWLNRAARGRSVNGLGWCNALISETPRSPDTVEAALKEGPWTWIEVGNGELSALASRDLRMCLSKARLVRFVACGLTYEDANAIFDQLDHGTVELVDFSDNLFDKKLAACPDHITDATRVGARTLPVGIRHHVVYAQEGARLERGEHAEVLTDYAAAVKAGWVPEDMSASGWLDHQTAAIEELKIEHPDLMSEREYRQELLRLAHELGS